MMGGQWEVGWVGEDAAQAVSLWALLVQCFSPVLKGYFEVLHSLPLCPAQANRFRNPTDCSDSHRLVVLPGLCS